jgi:two-component system, NarL family, response regulator LiaR
VRSHDAVTVVIADDHELFRRGLVRLLEQAGIQVVGEAPDGVEAVDRCTELQPDVVVMDLHMPRMSGIDATRRIVAAGLRTQVAVLTVSAEESMVVDALLAGACGYLLKDAEADQVVTAVLAAARGESVISPRVAAKVVNRLRREPRRHGSDATAELTDRETVVLRLIAAGLGNHEIADQLYISENTVKNHVSNILVKLDVDNRVQAAVRAIIEGLIDPADPDGRSGDGSGQ